MRDSGPDAKEANGLLRRYPASGMTLWLNTAAGAHGDEMAMVLTAGTVERTFKEDARSRVDCVGLGEHQYIVKRYLAPRWKRWLYDLYGRVGVSPAWREWRGVRRLVKAGRRVSQPLALGRGSAIRGGTEALVLPYIEGDSLHGAIAGRMGPLPRAQRARLAEAVGRQVGLLSAAGIINRDHKPSNLMVDAACLAGAEPVMIDPVGLRRRRGDQQVVKMLAVLGRASAQAGEVNRAERLRCLRAVVAADPSLAAGTGDRLRTVAEWVDRAMNG